MYTIAIESYTKLGEREWREVVQAGNKSAATRKANLVVRSTGEAVQIDKLVNQYDETIEIWRLK